LEKTLSLITEKATGSGAVIQLVPAQFARVLARIDEPIVVVANSGWPKKGQKYLTSFKGFVFCTSSDEPLILPDNVEVIEARKIKLPG